MREHVTTYEEAVMLHLEFVDSPVAEHNRRVYKKEIALTAVGLTVTALALSIVLWLMGKDPVAYLIIEAPVIVIITFLMYLCTVASSRASLPSRMARILKAKMRQA